MTASSNVGETPALQSTSGPAPSRWGGWWPMVAICGTGLLLSIGGAFMAHQLDQEALQVDFERRTGNFMVFLQTDIAGDYTADNHRRLKALRAQIAEHGLTDAVLDPLKSETQSSNLIKSSLIVVERVPAADASAFESRMAEKLHEPYRIHPLEGVSHFEKGSPSPEVYYPIVNARAQDPAMEHLGADIAFTKVANLTLESVLDHGYPVSFGSADESSDLTFVHMIPLPDGIPHPDDPGKDFEGFIGFFTKTTLGGLSRFFPLSMAGVDTYLFAPTDPGSRWRPTSADATSPSAIARASTLAEHGFMGGANIDMGGLNWRMTSAPRPQHYALHNSHRPFYVAALVLVLTAITCVGAARSQSRARRIERLIQQRTTELSNANEELAREIGERKKTEAALMKSQEMYELLSKNVTDVIWTADLNLAIDYVSPSIKRLRGFSPDEVRQQTFEEIMTPDSYASILPVIAEGMERVAAGEVDPPPSYTLELDMYCRDGSTVRTEATASVMLDEQNEVVGFLGVTRDIEARKRAQEETATLESQLRQSQKMEAIGTLAGGVAHDFNNLLTGILGYANLIKLQTNEENPIYESADVIEKAAERASDLTRQLLGFARQGKLQNSVVDMHNMINESVALLRRTIDKSINIVQRMDAPSPEVMGDPSQIQLVVLNLAVNARDAMSDGGELTIETRNVDVCAATHCDLKPGAYVSMRITDTGPGIPADIQERIFEPFFTTKSREEGTGMGLATVYGIAKNHGGLVTVESTVGKGTTFEVLLPAAMSVQEAGEPEPFETVVQGRGKILVVEDEEVVRKLATDILGWLGYETVTVCDGVEAVEYYGECAGEIDLALIDLNMPRMGGRECYQKMKAINPALRAVLSTGYSRDGAAQELLDDGIQGFVQKPFQASQLSEAIAMALQPPQSTLS